MELIAKKHAPFELVVYYPKDEKGKKELAERVAEVHAESVLQMVHKLDCSMKWSRRQRDGIGIWKDNR